MEAEQKYSETHPTVKITGIHNPVPEVMMMTVEPIIGEKPIKILIRQNGDCLVTVKGNSALEKLKQLHGRRTAPLNTVMEVTEEITKMTVEELRRELEKKLDLDQETSS